MYNVSVVSMHVHIHDYTLLITRTSSVAIYMHGHVAYYIHVIVCKFSEIC